jgi:spermidine synthase
VEHPVILPVLLLLSGAAALAHEVLWARDWALLYGSTAVGSAVVLAAYFTGLAGGAALSPRMLGGRSPLVVYAGLELGVAATVVGYLVLRPLLPGAAIWLARVTPGAVLPGTRALLALAVLVVPTTLLGATLPVVAATRPADRSGGVGRLYAWNTLGGAAGALAGGLVGVRALGVRGTFLAAAGLDVVVAAGALALARGRSLAMPGPAAAGSRTARPGAAVMVAALAGFVGLADEVLWTRGLAGVLSNSVYSIALVLAAMLLGIVIGARVGAHVAERPGPVAPRLGAASALLALATVGSVFALRALPDTMVLAARWLGVAGPGAGLAVEAGLAVLVVLVPATALGALFPLCLALGGWGTPGRAMGRVLAANTTGGIGGALIGAFVILPSLGLRGGLLTTAALATAVAAVLARGTRGRALAAVVAIAVVATLASPPVRPAGRDLSPAERLLFYRDGATATVAVTADARGQQRLRVNGQYSLGGTEGVFLERREAHLPLLLHPAPTRMLALGVGTADTVGAAVAHPDLRVDGVELVPEVLEAAALFGRENGGVLANPRARLRVDDARSHLLATAETYDVILSDLFLPWTTGTAALYSREMYRLGLAHLRPGGLYCQWLPLHQLGVGDLEAIVATFVGVFPEVQLWVAYHRAATPLAALIGSTQVLHADAAALRARLRDPTLARALADAGLDDPRDLAVLYVTDGARLRAVTAGVAPITDDRPRLEFSAPAAYFHQQGLGWAALAWVAARLDPAPAPIADDLPATFALRAALLRAQLALLAGDGPAELSAYVEALRLAPEVRAVRAALIAIARARVAAGDRTTAGLIADELRHQAPAAPETLEAEALSPARRPGESGSVP